MPCLFCGSLFFQPLLFFCCSQPGFLGGFRIGQIQALQELVGGIPVKIVIVLRVQDIFPNLMIPDIIVQSSHLALRRQNVTFLYHRGHTGLVQHGHKGFPYPQVDQSVIGVETLDRKSVV